MLVLKLHHRDDSEPSDAVALLAILHASEVRPNFPPCLANIRPVVCLQDIRPELLQISVDKSSVVPLYLPEDGPQQLVWIQESTIDNSFRTPEYEAEVADFIDWLVSEKCVAYPDRQTILFEGENSATASLVYRTANSGVVAKVLPISASPMSYLPVPETAIERVRDILFGLERAPGGNDDGSGTISILNIARRIRQTGITFRTNVELVVFAGEEQGLLGSKAYAKELRERGANIVLMIQADMLAYHVPDERPQLGLAQFIGTPELGSPLSAVAITRYDTLSFSVLIYGYEYSRFSGGKSFHEQGYPAHLFERAGPIADPMYHNSGDLSDRPGYDLNQVRSICKVQFATLLHAAVSISLRVST
ncbi:hypothetical protein EDC04DRAFT_2913983 [Pisolithus marmoratus]|nr:hypothetical protein EDC04DRAFT_2913983 [Pisolithus marmoratus]